LRVIIHNEIGETTLDAPRAGMVLPWGARGIMQ
jgi:hypothetical protein